MKTSLKSPPNPWPFGRAHDRKAGLCLATRAADRSCLALAYWAFAVAAAACRWGFPRHPGRPSLKARRFRFIGYDAERRRGGRVRGQERVLLIGFGNMGQALV